MKRTQEILGLPIISISEGVEVGKVKSIIVNADKGAIDYIIVDSGIQIMGARVVPTEKILGIGEYAVTIESESAINDIGKVPSAIDLLQKNIQVKGTKVLTKKGRLIGEIGDIYVDDDNACMITGVEFLSDVSQKKVSIIPRERIITFGKNLAIVSDDVEGSLVDKSSSLSSVDVLSEQKKNEFSISESKYEPSLLNFDIPEVTNQAEIKFDESESYILKSEFVEEQNPLPEGQEVPAFTGNFREEEFNEYDTESTDTGNPEESDTNLFEHRQKQYLIGRKVTKNIFDNDGYIIIEEGSIITDEIFEKVKIAQKMVDLVMNNKSL
jgi:uncharacterized protein YrrD